jgi:hypothetical protein
MGTVYRKTPKGIVEIETRVHRLTPRMRSTLILVDGRKSDDDLRVLITTGLDETLASLQGDGFIEAVGVPNASRATSAAAPSSQPKATTPTAPAASPAAARVDIATLRREAVRALTDQVGPMGETLAMKMERCRDTAELRPLLDMAAQVIGNVRGAQAAAAYRSRFLTG